MIPLKQTFTASVSREGRGFVAQCHTVDVATQGRTECQALRNLKEAIELHFKVPHATVTPKVCQFEADISAL